MSERERKRSAQTLIAVALAASAFRVRPAAADPTPPPRGVYLERSACAEAPPDEVAAILRVELFNRLLEGPPPPSDAYRTTIECSGSTVAITVGVPSGASKSLQANLGRVPANVRSRIVALSIAELVRDLDREPRPLPVVEAPPPPPRVERDERPPPRAPNPASPVHLGALAQTSSFQLNGVWLAGGGLTFDYVYRRFCAGLDTAVLTTTERFEQGTAQALLAYAGPSVSWQERWGRARMRLGAGYAVGAARLSGRATVPGTFEGTTTGAWTAPFTFAAFALTIVDDVSVDARGQLGWVTSPVVGEVSGGAGVALEGLWASVQLGVTIGL